MVFETGTTGGRAELEDRVVRSRVLIAAPLDPAARRIVADLTVDLDGKPAQRDPAAGV
jgi:hypothetical protein